MAEKTARKKQRTVIFEIRTSLALPVGQQVFVAGNTEMLGYWKPDGFPLTRMGENLWSGTALLPAADTIEYKVTRGSWDAEEVQADGQPPMNSALKPGGTITVRRTVHSWKDQAPA